MKIIINLKEKKNYNKKNNDKDKNIEHDIETNNEEEVKNNNKNEVEENLNDDENGGVQDNLPYIVEEQENLIANHMDIIKSEAKLLTEEGNLISKIKGITEENYSMEEYVPKIEEIIETKLNYFKELKQKIKEYKSLLG